MIIMVISSNVRLIDGAIRRRRVVGVVVVVDEDVVPVR